MDMKLPGAHLQSLAEEWRFKAEDLFRQSADLKLKAEVIQASAAALERAIREEAKKLPAPAAGGE